MRLKLNKHQERETVFFLCFYLLVFQNPLTEYVSGVFSFVDEVVALLGVVFAVYLGFNNSKKLVVRKDTLKIVQALLVFVACGLLANLIYQYQPIQLVMKDLFVNMKFFLAVITGFYLFRYAKPGKKTMLLHTKICTVLLFSLLIADVLFDLFPSEGFRYGIKIRNLIFGHVTYLAGACAFLLALLTFYFEKRNLPYIVMALILLASTTRSKALASGAAYVIVLYIVLLKQQRMKLWQILVIGVLGIYIAWDQISFYYVELSDRSARAVLTQTSFRIMKDYFPIGTGFGTYASDVAGEHYSPVYVKYGFTQVYELRKESGYLSDTFWPIIIGQTGFIGLICYLFVLVKLFLKTAQARLTDRRIYAAVIFIFIYLMISSTSEPTFCNSISIPLGMMLGYTLHLIETPQRSEGLPARERRNHE